MELRDFLIRLKIGTRISIKKQYQIYVELSDTTDVNITTWLATSNVIKPKDKEQILDELTCHELDDEITLNQQNGGIITILDESYPTLLREIFCPPTVLFYRGKLDLLNHDKLVGIVGARLISRYGEKSVACLIPQLANHDIVTVSGLAKGVDTAVHFHTLKNAGQTIAVIGTGLDQNYPKNNLTLQKNVQDLGLLLSEYPMRSKPLRHHFVERNRIIAGISKAVCIIEAKQKSGSLITANFALSENRNVLAIPGSIFSLNSKGTNDLIAAGARPLLTIDDILEEVNFQ